MNRMKLLLLGLLVALPILAGVSVARAQDFHTGNDITVAKGETVDKTFFAAGRTVDIAGKINGDVFCAGQNITISGEVTGDVICAGQTVRVSGTVGGDVRVAGQSVTLSGTIMHNLSAAGQSVVSDSDSIVKGDASIGGQTATLNGSVGRDLAAGSNSLTLNNVVGRDVQVSGQDLTLGGNAKIAGNVIYTSRNQLHREGGAQIAGHITHNLPKQHERHARVGSIFRMSIWFALYMLLAALLVGLVLVLLMPHAFHGASETALHHPGKTLLTGFIASIVAPIVVILLMFTVVGIPLGVLLLLAWLLVLALAGPFAAYYTGRLLMQKATNAIAIMALGTLVLLLLYFVPILGGIVWFLALWFGLGIILLQAKRLPKQRYDTVAIETSAKPKTAQKPKK